MRRKFWNSAIHLQILDLYNILKEIPSGKWNDDKFLFQTVHEFSKKKTEEAKKEIGLGTIFNTLRLLVMGTSVGAGMPHSLATLGRAPVLRRLARGLDVDAQ
eukprot:Phypoly_transcript_18322.p1 GENE.Phypoly_transcript_18322~~Phypoly_transcript_18322.p1  ORF type:complete len:102 (+),score=21.35 Phypoly_transcript_18322:451-756(+)